MFLIHLKIYFGKDCVGKFNASLYNISTETKDRSNCCVKKEHETAEKCHTCFRKFNKPAKRKVKEQCHYTGLNRGPVGNNFNLKFIISDDI